MTHACDRHDEAAPPVPDAAAGTPAVPAPNRAGAAPTEAPANATAHPVEIGGADGPEPTRFGDWEHNGRCTDF